MVFPKKTSRSNHKQKSNKMKKSAGRPKQGKLKDKKMRELSEQRRFDKRREMPRKVINFHTTTLQKLGRLVKDRDFKKGGIGDALSRTNTLQMICLNADKHKNIRNQLKDMLVRNLKGLGIKFVRFATGYNQSAEARKYTKKQREQLYNKDPEKWEEIFHHSTLDPWIVKKTNEQNDDELVTISHNDTGESKIFKYAVYTFYVLLKATSPVNFYFDSTNNEDYDDKVTLTAGQGLIFNACLWHKASQEKKNKVDSRTFANLSFYASRL